MQGLLCSLALSKSWLKCHPLREAGLNHLTQNSPSKVPLSASPASSVFPELGTTWHLCCVPPGPSALRAEAVSLPSLRSRLDWAHHPGVGRACQGLEGEGSTVCQLGAPRCPGSSGRSLRWVGCCLPEGADRAATSTQRSILSHWEFDRKIPSPISPACVFCVFIKF